MHKKNKGIEKLPCPVSHYTHTIFLYLYIFLLVNSKLGTYTAK
jgi:hypothetical protein